SSVRKRSMSAWVSASTSSETVASISAAKSSASERAERSFGVDAPSSPLAAQPSSHPSHAARESENTTKKKRERRRGVRIVVLRGRGGSHLEGERGGKGVV